MAVENADLFRHVVEKLPSGAHIVDRERRILFWNAAAERISGHLRHEVLGRFCREDVLQHCDDAGESLCRTACPLAEAIRDGHERRSNIFLRHKRGHLVPVNLCAIPLRNDQDAVVGAVEIFEPRHTEPAPRRKQVSLAAHGCTSAVTGLPNAQYTQFELEQSLARFHKFGVGFGILRIRPDWLDSLTAMRGKQAVHELLLEMAQTIANVAPDDATLGMWRENEFLIILPEMSLHTLTVCAGDIQRMISHSEVRWWGEPLPVQVQVAGAIAMRGESLAALVERASPGDGPAASHPGSTRG